MMNTLERRQAIVEQTNRTGKVDVAELAEKHCVSTVTIRSDLSALDKKGLVIRSRGGAIAKNKVSKELSISEKHNEQSKIKKKLGAAAAQLIKNGDSVILDSGTTTEEVARELLSIENLFVMTNGLNIANTLLTNDAVEVMCTGGTLRKKSLSFYGRQAEANLADMRFDKVILGVDGIDEAAGITTHFEPEANLNKMMANISRQVIAVTDASKFTRSGFHVIIPFERIDTLITDSRLSKEHQELLAEYDIELIIIPYEE